jgi:DNA-directed RNA polymerase subunit K/omega
VADITNEKGLAKTGNHFILAILLSERVKELRQGAKPLVETGFHDPPDIAMQEICAGKINFKLPQQNDET